MDEYVPGSISNMLLGNTEKTKKKKSKNKTPDMKSVKFQEIDDEVNRKKYLKTPYSEVGKKTEKLKSDLEGKSGKRKLKFDETSDDVEESKPPKKLKKQKPVSEIEKPEKSKKKKKKSHDAEKVEDDNNYIPIEASNDNFESNFSENGNNNVREKKNKKPKTVKEKRPIDPDELKKTVFVGNVPINYSREKIASIFSQFGPVFKVRLRCIPVGKLGLTKKEAAIRKEFHPNRKSLAAYVVFMSEKAVPAALEENGMLADGHHLRIDVAEKKEHDINRAVFIGNLPFDVEDDEVWGLFEKCGEIENVRIIRDNHTMIGKGFGYVNFESSASVELALELNGQEIRNRQINVQRCTNVRKKKKFNKGESSNSVGNVFRPNNKFKKFKNKNKVNGNEVAAKQVGSASQFQGRKAETGKKKKKKHKLSKYEMKKKKFQKLLAPSGSGKK